MLMTRTTDTYKNKLAALAVAGLLLCGCEEAHAMTYCEMFSDLLGKLVAFKGSNSNGFDSLGVDIRPTQELDCRVLLLAGIHDRQLSCRPVMPTSTIRRSYARFVFDYLRFCAEHKLLTPGGKVSQSWLNQMSGAPNFGYDTEHATFTAYISNDDLVVVLEQGK